MNNGNSREIRKTISQLQTILSRLRGVEETSSGYSALCPAHDDDNPSLSVDEGEDGRVLLHCHAGCESEEVVQALGLEISDLFPPDLDASWEPWDGTEVAAYTYTNKLGNECFQVVRYEMRNESHPAYGEKKFLQRAYDPSHEDAGDNGCPPGFVWGRQGTNPLLYKLPKVDTAVEEGETIFFVEGEKDVHTLLDEGLNATCNPGGAAKGEDPGGKLTPGMIEPLRGADVVVIPDADEPGRQFAKAVAKCLYPVADQVRVVELPGVQEGEDVTDYLQSGHRVEDLAEIVEDTEPFRPPPETADQLVERARESGDPAVVYEHIDLLATTSEGGYRKARSRLKAATGIDLNGLEAARQDAIKRLKKQKEKKKRKEKWNQLDADGLPTIQLGNDRPNRKVVSEATRAFEAFNDPPEYFERGGETVQITNGERGRPTFETVEEPLFDDLLTRAADFVRITDGGIVHSDPSLRLVRRVRQQVDLPGLKGIREVPFLRLDGSVARESGYDEETRLVYRPNPKIEIPEVPERPSKESLGAAVKLLLEPFCDFPFVDKASQANVLATVLTPLLRPLLDGANVPLVIFDATKQGTGKSLLADVVSLMGMGRVPATMSAPSSNEEWRKQITAQFRKGEPVIVVDNVKGRIESSALERVITARTWGDRILGHSKQVRLPADALWIATGNNLRPRGEMTRRCILVRMDAEMVRPWQRDDFKHPELRDWVRSNRGRLVAASLTAIRSWVEAGRPTSDVDAIGSFERWAEVTGGILQHIGIEGFLENLDELYETAGEEEHRWSRFLEAVYGWSLEDESPTPFTTKELAEAIDAHVEGRFEASGETISQVREELPDKLQQKLQYGNPIARSLGKMFAYREGRRFPGGWRVERAERNRDGIHWMVCQCAEGDTRYNASLDPSERGSPYTPTPDAEEGGGSGSHRTGDLNSHRNKSSGEAPF